MSTRTKIETFPKTDWTSEQVDAVQAAHLAAGAVSCDKSEDDDAYHLTSVWRVH